MKISVIIPNYNGENILKKNLPDVLKAVEAQDFEIIIVDDNSLDESMQFIKEFAGKMPGKIKFMKNDVNKGFSPTVNRGVAMAQGEIIVLLNTDVSPHVDFLKTLLPHFKDDKVFAVGCMDESIENGQIVLRGRGIGEWKNGFLLHSAGSLDESNTLWVSGGSGAFRKSIWDKLGGLDEVYAPFYWEDIDLSYRALKSGYKLIFEKESKVRHEHEKGAIKSEYTDFQIKRISYRNQIFFVWLNITDFNLLLSHFLWLPYNITFSLVKGDLGLLLGFLFALLRLPTIVAHRTGRAKNFTLKDADIFNEFI